MNRIGIRELRADLSNQVKRVANGEPVVITVDGEPKVVMSSFDAGRTEMTLDELIAAGRVIPGPRRNEPRPEPPPRVAGSRPSSEILDEIRSDRF